MNAIIAATRTNAALLRIEKETGTVEEGKRADLILLDADPLTDPAIFADPAHVRMVLLAGEVVKDLDAPTLPSPRGEGRLPR
jgi:imidazolonepropionase-like amidohydrolase